MDENAVLKKNPAIATRAIGEDTILVPVLKSSEEINCIYSFNKSAARVWELLDGKRTLAQVKAQLLKEFDCTDRRTSQKAFLPGKRARGDQGGDTCVRQEAGWPEAFI